MYRTPLPPRPRDAARMGGSLVLAVVLMLGVILFLALAIDLGMLFVARSEAQRAAEAGALAGASAFLEMDASVATGPATERAQTFAASNTVRNVLVDASEVGVEVETADKLVRVRVSREEVPTWFARLMGIESVPISAVAAARAEQAGAARCLKPFAVPDIWADADDDVNGNRLWDEGEEWDFDETTGDSYAEYTGGDGTGETGYGGPYRNPTDPDGIVNDYGRQIQIKYTDPSSEFILEPSIFLPWRIPEDPAMESCDLGGGGGSTGAAVYRQNICSCNNSPVQLGVPYDIEPGNMVGPTAQGVQELISEDPGAYWDPAADGGKGAVVGSSFGGDWISSPRVVKIALFDPFQVTKSGMISIEFNNFALFFIEEQRSRRDPVVGRFLYYAPGSGEGPTRGSLVYVLRLVE